MFFYISPADGGWLWDEVLVRTHVSVTGVTRREHMVTDQVLRVSVTPLLQHGRGLHAHHLAQQVAGHALLVLVRVGLAGVEEHKPATQGVGAGRAIVGNTQAHTPAKV